MNLRDYLASKEQELLNTLQSLTSIVDHDGETGETLEMGVTRLLKQYLPARYDVSTGFVRCVDDLEWQSRQIDLLLTRADIGHPLAVFPTFKVFPIEAVAGFVEVTRTLDKKKLDEDFSKVQELKHKTKRTYIFPYPYAKAVGLVPRDVPDDPSDLLKKVYVQLNDLEPRFFYFAYTSEWKNPESLCRVLKELGNRYDVHCHGLFIPQFGLFFHKAVYEPPSHHDVRYVTRMPDAFVGFIHQILSSLQSFTDVPSNAAIPLDKYGLLSPNDELSYEE